MVEMYKGVANSPETTITNDINNTDTIIYVLDETRIPELPNIMVLGTGTSAETIKVLSIDGNAITVERGFQGVPRNWNAGTVIARNFTEYDYNALVENIEILDVGISDLAGEGRTTETVKEIADDLVSHKAETIHQGKHNILEATSTDNATSNTSAPLKTAGGLAVAKDAMIGGAIWADDCLGKWFRRRLFLPARSSQTSWEIQIDLTNNDSTYFIDVVAIGRWNANDRRGIHKKTYSGLSASIHNAPIEVYKTGITGLDLGPISGSSGKISIQVTHTTGANVDVFIDGTTSSYGNCKSIELIEIT